MARALHTFIFFLFLSITAFAAGPPTVVFMTDFGVIDDSVAICKGVMIGIEPALRIIDITHQVTPYSIEEGARYLAGATPYFPEGTVFVIVIDPGVGSARKPMVAKSSKGQFFVLPDNGLITLVQDRDGLEGAREITNTKWMIGGALSSTFHGRDIFSPVAAHLAKGEDWTQLGPVIEKPVQLKVSNAKVNDHGISGGVIGLDGPYGNLITNISGDQFKQLGYEIGESVRIDIAQRTLTLPFVKTFSDVPLHKPLLYIDSRGRLGLAINQGNFAKLYHIQPPVIISIPRKRSRD